ncbi:hypothetical protein CAPTEDRAFT_219996 [Capitella teleta]|uniref:Amino acid permease/ SLC12A domain-containing protein n=1 Tax=Capitella teleta TaxID=283909 RepID=R7UC20_CAPTE|nr:hypothetical protein CAPTEDRAFT_219996 [Capitella teleta]|eukprot:ELU00812.1 hypothetical protein CAPTEDRAFT_219996 [Capitella teleta]
MVAGGRMRTLSASSRASQLSYKTVDGVFYDEHGEPDTTISLKPKITLVNGITVIVGSIIGSGIFVSPKGVLEQTGSVGVALMVWLGCGLYSMVGAHCFMELGCAIPKSGADYAYIREAFGDLLGFLRLYIECIVVRPCSQAVVALTFAYYVIEPIFPDCEQPENAARLLAAICISFSFTCAFRLFFAGSREGHMPEVLSYVQVHRMTPAPAVIFMGMTSLIYLCSTDMYALINYVAFVNWLAVGLAVGALLYFRYTRPDMKRPIKVGLVWPIIYCAFSVFLVIVPLYASPFETGMGCLIIATGIPIYFIFVKWQKKPVAFLRFMNKVNRGIQKALLVVPEENKTQ